MSTFSFDKSQKLKSDKIIGQLFQSGKSVAKFPIRLVWMPVATREEDSLFQIAVTVPKKNFKSAVSRNRIKRQLREAYRLNKSILYQSITDTSVHYAMMILYTGKEGFAYAHIEHSLIKAMRLMLREVGVQGYSE